MWLECGKIIFEDMKARTKVHLDIQISLSNFNMPVVNKAGGIYFPGTPLPLHEKADGKLSILFRSLLDVNFLLFICRRDADTALIAASFKLCSPKLLSGTSLRRNE